MARYVVASDMEEAKERALSQLYLKDLDAAVKLAVVRTDKDECTPKCTYEVYEMKIKVDLVKVT